MSQYNTRINIRVTNEEDWFKLSNIDFEEYGLWLSSEDFDGVEFIIDGDWSLTESELDDLIGEIADCLGDDVIVVADTTNINVDPYLYYVCILGCNIYSGETYHEDDDFTEQYDLDIADFDKYCKELGVTIPESIKKKFKI